MKNYLLSAAIGDIAGSAYEGRTRRTKDYDAVKLFSSRARFTDDTVLTFACAEAFLDGKDMAVNLWKCRYAGGGRRPHGVRLLPGNARQSGVCRAEETAGLDGRRERKI